MMNQLQVEALDNVHNGTKNIQPTGLLGMPLELIDIILSNLHTTKNLRLISKKFSNNLTICRYVFSVFTLWPRVDCYKALDLIAHNPNLSPFVETIRVSNQPRLYRFGSLLEWADTRPDVNFSHPSTHDLWTKYRTWVEAETHFWEDGVIPRLNLRLLENLQTVEMAGTYQLQRETADGQMIHRREEDTKSSYHARPWKYGHGYHNNCHFGTFARGSLSSLKTLKTLVVHKLQELMGVSEVFKLPRLECLDIHMETLMLWTAADADFGNYVAPAPWLLSLRCLTTLKLTQCPLSMKNFNSDFCYPDVIQLIKNIEFPNLREVRFETITTKAQALHRFLLHTNVRYIKVLSILSPAIADHCWSHLRTLLEKTVPPYEYLELSDAYSYGSKNRCQQDHLYSCVFRYAPPPKKGNCNYPNFPPSNLPTSH